jgi:glycosyltransferase involved in cell wall biosynthesis
MMVTNPVTHDARVINEASVLASNNYQVTLLGTKDDGSRSEEYLQGFQIKRLARGIGGSKVLDKFIFTFKFTLAAIREKADIYHANDLSTLLECYLAARIRRAGIIYDSHELYYSTISRGFGGWIYSQIEKLLIQRVDAVITVNTYIAQFLEKHYRLEKPVFVLMNCPPLKPLLEAGLPGDPPPCLGQMRAAKSKNKKIVLYQGLIHPERCLEQLIEAMTFLPENYCLFILGDGDNLTELKALAAKLNLDERVFFAGLIRVEQLSACTVLADVGITLNEGKLLTQYYASPNKLFQYIHAGIPVVARNFPLLKEVVETYEIGLLLNGIDPQEISFAIKSILEDEPRYLRMKANTLLAKERFNWENESRVLLKVYAQTGDSRNRKS